MNIVKFFARQNVFVNLVTVFLVVVGSFSALSMRREAFPAISIPVVSITTVYPGAAPSEIEKLITIPIEQEIESLSNIKRIWSTSAENISAIIVEIEPDSNVEKVTANIRREVEGVDGLPQDAEDPELMEWEPFFPIFRVSMANPGVSELEMRLVAKKLQEDIEDVKGVAKVTAAGLHDEEIWVEVNPEQIQKRRLPLEVIVDAIRRQNIQLPGGRLETGGKETLVRTVGEFENEEQIEDIVVRSNDEGSRIRVKDVATVRKTLQEARQLYRVNSADSISMIIQKNTSGDSLDIGAEVRVLLAEFEKEHPEFKLSISDDSTFYIERRLRVLTGNAVVGLVLVGLLLLLFLNPTTSLFTALGLAVAMLSGILIARFFGMTINLLTMFGFVMALGMLVDDGVVVSENIFRRIQAGEDPQTAAEEGASEIILPLTASVATTVAAFIPIVFMAGIMGQFMSHIPKIVVVCLVASLIESFLILPSHLADFSKLESLRLFKAITTWQQRVVEPLYQKMKGLVMGALRYTVDRPWKTLGAASVLTAGVFVMTAVAFSFGMLSFRLFPSPAEEFQIDFDMKTGTSLELTSQKAREIEEMVKREVPAKEVDVVITTVGANGDADMMKRGSHLGSVRVVLMREFPGFGERVARLAHLAEPDLRDGDVIKEDVASRVRGMKDIEKIEVKGRRAGPPAGKPVSIVLTNGSQQDLQKASLLIQDELKKIEGVKDIGDDLDLGKDEIILRVDERKAALAGLTVQQIASAVRGAIDGIEATSIKRGTEEVVVRVRYKETIKRDPGAIRKIKVATPRGRILSLENLVRFESKRGPMQIMHFDGKLAATVTADIDRTVRGASSQKANSQIEPKVKEIVAGFKRMGYRMIGENEDTKESMESLLRLFIVAILLIFVILATQFKSLMQPLIIMTAIPLGLVGVSLVHLSHNIVGSMPFSMLSMLGTVALSGVVVNNAILLIEFANRARDEGATPVEAVLAAGERRFRPIMLTSLTTIAGLLPMGYGVPEIEPFLAPMALVLAWGITFSGFLTFFVVPSIWVLMYPLIYRK